MKYRVVDDLGRTVMRMSVAVRRREAVRRAVGNELKRVVKMFYCDHRVTVKDDLTCVIRDRNNGKLLMIALKEEI